MITLVNSPFFDPTTPPHSAAYLAGALRKNGQGPIEFIDVNCELHNHICSEWFFNEVRTRNEDLISRYNSKEELSRIERMRYRSALKVLPLSWTQVASSISVLTDKTDFYVYPMYRGAVELLERYFETVSATTNPGLFSVGRLNTRIFGSVTSLEDFSNPEFIDIFVKPFRNYFDNLLERLKNSRSRVVGISCNYTDQLPYTVYLANRLAREASSTLVVVGGTEITDLYKNVNSVDAIWSVLDPKTRIVVGEGEGALSSIVKQMQGQGSVSIRSNVPGGIHQNVVVHGQTVPVTQAVSENINEIGSPDYTIYDLEAYWVPEPLVMYSPTRGCYWNKCTFCDYGLNFGLPTSPSRQRSTELLTEDLREISKHTRYVYLAVDAISPSYLRRLADTISQEALDLRWSAEVRLDKSASSINYASRLKRGGCVALSFGFESGSQRVLDLIDKGVDLTRASELLGELSESDIHVQMMGFTGFPSESPDEFNETFEFLSRHRENWTFAGIGQFALTPGAIVAKQPGRFGIEEVVADPLDTIVRELKWVESTRPGQNGGFGKRKEPRNRNWKAPLQRPFVGGIDTAHSILYFAKYQDRSELQIMLDLPAGHVSQEIQIEGCFDTILEFERPVDIEDSMNNATGKIAINSGFLAKSAWLRQDIKSVNTQRIRVTSKPSGNIYISLPHVANDALANLLEEICL